MKGLVKNTKGAVTVFVTFLLIPAVLISGTAVDLTRIYTARSIVQDANQLAANSVLTQYNALLKDLYGLFGIADNDPVLAELLDEYISVTVFGEDSRDTSLGTFQLFYGSNLTTEGINFSSKKNLRNPDVLRRQIEEYMKFRGPVIIVKELLELLGSSSFSTDTEIINDKLKIDETIAEMYEKYKELYEAILAADNCRQPESNGGIAGGTVGTVGSSLTAIHGDFVELKDIYTKWLKCHEDLATEEAKSAPSATKITKLQEDIADLEAHYNAILVNIEIRTTGGKIGKNWSNGKWTSSSTALKGLIPTITDAVARVDTFKPKFDAVVSISKELDSMNAELKQMIDSLEERLKKDDCDASLKYALTQERDPETGLTVLETYREILKWDDIESLGKIYKDSGYEYLDVILKDTLRNAELRNKDNESSPSLTQSQLQSASSIPALQIENAGGLVSTIAGYSSVSYEMPLEFVKYGEHPGDNQAFFEDLKKMMSLDDVPLTALFEGQEEAGGKDSKEKQNNMIDEILKLVDTAYEGLTNNPLGAKYINSASSDEEDASASNISDAAAEASGNPVSVVISDPYGSIAAAGDYLLLMTYCTSMFSNYTTTRPASNGKTIDDIDDISFPKSISGVPISPQVNYFYQSEWEYLYNGSEDAGKNLSAVSRLIYIVRVICNYITVFSVKEISAIVSSIRTAFSWSPPLGVVLGELARAAFVAAESAIDLATLRAGYNVPLIKNAKNGEWVCSPSGLVNALDNLFTSDDEKKDSGGLSYSNYLLFFMLAKGFGGESAIDELTDRTASLIEWNVINYKERIWCDEEKMAEAIVADNRFKMERMKTDFEITTSVDMRMLFLSMVLFQNYSEANGAGLSGTYPLTVTDYRGY